MAKSKSGGTRSYIRGRVGADVYSIGRDAKGAKQQVVRSLAETVANPQTIAQMRGRMIMSTVMQAVSAMRPIIDHSFDNVPNGQPSISEFISRNYSLVKADVAAHPASDNKFGLNMYQEKGIKNGAWLISAGEVVLPAALKVDTDTPAVQVDLGKTAATMGDLKTALGLGADDYITLVGIDALEGFKYCRLHWNEPADLTTALSASNFMSCFTLEGNFTPTVEKTQNPNKDQYNFSNGFMTTNAGVILTKKTTSGYQHSTCELYNESESLYPADTALPTYPVGTEMFLNGGDL